MLSNQPACSLTDPGKSLSALMEQARYVRVQALLGQLRDQGELSRCLQHAASLPPRQLASALSQLLSPGELARRLACLGISRKWCNASLEMLDLTSGTVAVTRADAGCALVGPGIRARLLSAFPELLPLALTNSTILAPGTGAAAIAQPPRTGGSADIHADLSLISNKWEIKSVSARYLLGGDSTTSITNVMLSDGYGSFSGLGSDQGIDWGKAGKDWVLAHAGESFTTNGVFSFSFEVADPHADWTITGYFIGLSIEYTGAGGDPCQDAAAGTVNSGDCSPCRTSNCNCPGS